MNFNFCPTCAAPLIQLTPTDYQCSNGHPYWNNAKAAVAVILCRDNQLLFAERKGPPAAGKFDFPGGFVNYGELPLEAARRELQEEADIIINDLQLIDVRMNIYAPGISTADIIWLCRDWQGEPRAADDVASLQWKPLEFILTDDFAWPDYRPLYDRIKFSLTPVSGILSDNHADHS